MFHIDSGSPGASVTIAYSSDGNGPTALANGLVLDLSAPINQLGTIVLNSLGSASLGPFPLPGSIVAGTEIWVQAMQTDSQSLSLTNMVAMTVLADLPDGMVAIPGGVINRDQRYGWYNPPMHSNKMQDFPALVDDFYMDEHEVTNLKFVDYLNDELASGNIYININDEVFQVGSNNVLISDLNDNDLIYNANSFSYISGKRNHPVSGVTWHGSALYCNWLSRENMLTESYDTSTWYYDINSSGYRLPSNAEFEYASRGGHLNPYFDFPWGSHFITHADANYGPFGNSLASAEVGSYAPNGYGLYDVSGNVEEWCGDWKHDYAPGFQLNPTGPLDAGSGAFAYKIHRGGNYESFSEYLRCRARGARTVDSTSELCGFRTVRR